MPARTGVVRQLSPAGPGPAKGGGMIHPTQINHPQPRRPETRQESPLLSGRAAGAPPRQAAG